VGRSQAGQGMIRPSNATKHLWSELNKLRLTVKCPDCGAEPGTECYPEYGCDDEDRTVAAIRVSRTERGFE
jgi:hypothetical protein